ncbi:MAG: hypothetical protein M3294_01390 [Pseudomonadota bacterium]|nr:hypothetical protein [Pseudomonadota bacterium]
MKNFVIASAVTSFEGGIATGIRGFDRFAETLPSARRPSVNAIKPGWGYALVSGIWGALMAAIITFISTIGVINLLRLM